MCVQNSGVVCRKFADYGKTLLGKNSFYGQTSARVWGVESVSTFFRVEQWVEGGCGMSPWLFSIQMDRSVREAY